MDWPWPQWVDRDELGARCVAFMAARNGGNLDGVSLERVHAVCRQVAAVLPRREVPLLPPGASCFCGRPCFCASQKVVQHDVRDFRTVAAWAVRDN